MRPAVRVQGLAFYWGTSEWTEAQIREAWSVAQRLNLQGPAMEQPQYNLFERKKARTAAWAASGCRACSWHKLQLCFCHYVGQ